MMIIVLEIIACLMSLLLGVWFLFGIIRKKKLLETQERYLIEFAEVCDDENIPLKFAENMQIVFKNSCGVCASTYLIGAVLARGDSRPDMGTVLILRALPAESAIRVRDSLMSLFNHVSYGAPVLGFILRRLLRSKAKKLYDGNGGKILFAAAERLSHAH